MAGSGNNDKIKVVKELPSNRRYLDKVSFITGQDNVLIIKRKELKISK